MVEKELKSLRKFAKEIISKKTFKKLRKIKEEKEKIDVLKHSIKSNLELKYHDLKEKIKKIKKQKKDSFFAEVKANLLSSKIKLFNATFHKKDFKNVLNLFKEAEKELKNA